MRTFRRALWGAAAAMAASALAAGAGAAAGEFVESAYLDQAGLAGDRGDARAAAGKALEVARRTLDGLSRRRPMTKLAAELTDLERRRTEGGEAVDWRRLYLETRFLRRRMVLSDPRLDFDRLLVVRRPPPAFGHMCDQYLGRHSRVGPGLTVVDNWKTAPQARSILQGKLPAGAVLHPDLSFDAQRLVFSFCDHTENDGNKRRFFLWECRIDGSGLRQITGVPGVDPLRGAGGRQTVLIEDFDPCYLPDGGIAFISTRNQGFGRCHGGRYTPSYVLYRCEADGRNIRPLSYNEANEWDPSVLSDGRLIYTRWDYINRHDTIFQSLWVMRPDGTATAHYYGNYTRNPCMTAEARAIPGSAKVVCTATAHHGYTGGSILVVDGDAADDGEVPLERITPEARFPETEGGPPLFIGPWPIGEDLFLAAYSRDPGRQAYGIYLVDAYGGREPVYLDPDTSCFTPIPLRPRPVPPVLPSHTDPERPDGVFYVQNVYKSTGDLAPGSIKRLRVVRMIWQPTASVPRRSAVDNEVVKGVLGTVPVEADGSVAFRAPAGEPLLFQLLDSSGMAVMSMRSLAYLQPGETSSCVGCHEPRSQSPPALPMARVTIRDIEPPAGPRYEGGLSFVRTVQPVLDRYCIRCHGLEKTEKGVVLLGEPTGQFNVAYETLTKRGRMVSLAHRNSEKPSSTPMLYGAHAGQLAPMLLADHAKNVRPDRESFARIAQWLDLNGQYYGDYDFKRAERRKPDDAGVRALREHVKAECGSCHAGLAEQPLAALVNVALPGESRVLKATLAAEAGGWGQCKRLSKDPGDAAYRALEEKVLAAVGPEPPRDGKVASR